MDAGSENGQSVTVSGRVTANSGLRSFKLKDGGLGQFASLTLAGGSGEVRVVVWGSHARLVWKAAVGDVVSLKDCVLRAVQGRIEYHALAESQLQAYPQPAAPSTC